MSSGDQGYGGDQTRTRLPESSSGDGYGTGRRPGGRPSRSLITVVGVVVLLVAAIAFANRGGGSGGNGGDDGGSGTPQAQRTAPTGERPVTGSEAGIASGFPKTEQGAESAAANYAVALGSDRMFNRAERHKVIDAITTEAARASLRQRMDKAYSEKLVESIGLDADGSAPKGMTFVNRTVPIGTKVTRYESDKASVEVWSASLFGLAGEGSTKPVSDGWFTITIDLAWTGDDWKVESHSQQDGPAPVRSDTTASGAEEIAEAVEGYGGFTYAR